MKYLLSILLLATLGHAENFTVGTTPALPEAPSARRFWTVETRVDASLLAGLIGADAITTQRGLNQGLREGNPLVRPLVTRGAAGQAAASALGFGAGLGTAYILHRTHHYKAERITMRLFVAGESGFVANNIVALR